MPNNPMGAKPKRKGGCAGTARDGLPCGNPPEKGHTVCKNHGSRSTGPKAGHGLYRRHFSGDTLAVHDESSPRDITPAYQAAGAMLDRALAMANDPNTPPQLMVAAMEAADRLFGRLGSLGNLALAQDAAKKDAENAGAGRVVMVEVPVVSQSAEEWLKLYGPKKPDELD